MTRGPRRRGRLVEAATYFGVAAGVAVVCALAWSALGQRDFLDALSVCLLVAGALVCVGATSLVSRLGMADARAAMGAPPEGPDESGGRSLTPLGLALLVGAPLLVAGTVVEIFA